MKCPKCNKNEAIEDRKYGILPCEECNKKDDEYELKTKPEFYTLSKMDRIVQQRDSMGKDLIQPFLDGKGTPNPEFVKAYPKQVDNYFTKEKLRNL